MTNPAWKRTERRIAAIIGGRRVPITGRARGNVPDIAHPLLSIEVKQRTQLPKWLLDALSQAEASATAGQLAVVVLHQAGQRYDNALALLRVSDLARIIAAGPDGEASE